MIQILPITEPDFLARMNKAYHVEATDGFVFIDKKEIKASLLYQIKQKAVTILSISTVEEDCFDGLVRACFASLIDAGFETATFDSKIDRAMLEKLGFVQPDTFFVNSLTECINNGRKCQCN